MICELPAGCQQEANPMWLYNAPGDIDFDNMMPLIHLCGDHGREALEAQYHRREDPNFQNNAQTTDRL